MSLVCTICLSRTLLHLCFSEPQQTASVDSLVFCLFLGLALWERKDKSEVKVLIPLVTCLSGICKLPMFFYWSQIVSGTPQSKLCRGMATCFLMSLISPLRGQRQADFCEVEAILVYRSIFRTAKVAQRNPVSKSKKTKQKELKTIKTLQRLKQ